MTKDNDKGATEGKVYSKLEEMDNKLERIKSDTHNLSRIASLSNASLIIQELKKIIGHSETKAAILHLTKEEIKASELAMRLGIDPGNLAVSMAPFLGNRGYVAVIQKGRERYFQRSELVDLVGFDSIEDFAPLVSAWEQKRKQQMTTNLNTSSEDTRAD